MSRTIRGAATRSIPIATRIRYALETTFVCAVFAAFRLMPLFWASAIGGVIARVLGPKLGREQIARQNLVRALPELDEDRVQEILCAMWENLGRTFAEFPRVGTMTRTEFDRLVTVEGADRVEELLGTGRRCIFFAAHLADWELAPKCLAMLGRPLALVYRRGNNPGLERLIQRNRNMYQIEAVPKGDAGARQLLRAIRAGTSIGILIDQKMNDGRPIEFFGRPAMTSPAIAQLALKYDCLLIPVRVVRTRGVRHHISILPPLPIVRTDDHNRDVAAILRSINRLLEEWIRENPGQWLWIHRRWP